MDNPFEILNERLINIENMLIELKRIAGINPAVAEKELLNIKEASELLNLSVATLYGHVSRRTIPFSKKGKRLYFTKSALISWVNSKE